jgi:GNAT superfamily N-acetyltransferase
MYDLSIYMSDHDEEQMADYVKYALEDSPIKLAPNYEALLNTIRAYAADTTDYDKFLCVCHKGDQYVGIVGGLVLKDHFVFMDHKVGQEIVWWVHPDHRGSKVASLLIRVLEEWARRKELNYLLMGHYEDEHSDKLKKMYTKNGYKLIEYNYIKELN